MPKRKQRELSDSESLESQYEGESESSESDRESSENDRESSENDRESSESSGSHREPPPSHGESSGVRAEELFTSLMRLLDSRSLLDLRSVREGFQRFLEGAPPYDLVAGSSNTFAGAVSLEFGPLPEVALGPIADLSQRLESFRRGEERQLRPSLQAALDALVSGPGQRDRARLVLERLLETVARSAGQVADFVRSSLEGGRVADRPPEIPEDLLRLLVGYRDELTVLLESLSGLLQRVEGSERAPRASTFEELVYDGATAAQGGAAARVLDNFELFLRRPSEHRLQLFLESLQRRHGRGPERTLSDQNLQEYAKALQRVEEEVSSADEGGSEVGEADAELTFAGVFAQCVAFFPEEAQLEKELLARVSRNLEDLARPRP